MVLSPELSLILDWNFGLGPPVLESKNPHTHEVCGFLDWTVAVVWMDWQFNFGRSIYR